MARLPEHLIEKQPRTLAHLKPGERARFPLFGFKIDADHNLFAILSAELEGEDPKVECGEIWRNGEGTYHADLKGTHRKWKPEDLRIYDMTKSPRIVPIATIAGTEPCMITRKTRDSTLYRTVINDSSLDTPEEM